MPDCVGVDQTIPASPVCLTFATSQLGQRPAFWGRYFKGPGNECPTQYQADLEANFLNANNIKVVPVGRQTGHVNQNDHDLGYQDGLRNAAAMLASFGAVHLSAMSEVAVFLDVEITNPLNRTYYVGWSAGLIDGGSKILIDFSDEISSHQVAPGTKVDFVPCLYAHHNDGQTWTELGAAMSQGAVCGAAWVVFMDSSTFPIGPWSPRFTAINMPPNVRVAIAQRILDFSDDHSHSYDFNLVNPAHQDWLLGRLTLPEAIALVS